MIYVALDVWRDLAALIGASSYQHPVAEKFAERLLWYHVLLVLSLPLSGALKFGFTVVANCLPHRIQILI